MGTTGTASSGVQTARRCLLAVRTVTFYPINVTVDPNVGVTIRTEAWLALAGAVSRKRH